MEMKVRQKYNAKATAVDEFKFSSKKEANEYERLKFLKEKGEILFFLQQVPFRLPGHVIYRLDFMILWANGELEFREVKGRMNNMGQLKINQTEALYGIKINVV